MRSKRNRIRGSLERGYGATDRLIGQGALRGGPFAPRGNRRRRHGPRLTLVGRASLLIVLIAMVGIAWGGQAAWRAWKTLGSDGLPKVSAAPPPILTAPLLADPPLTRERFHLARAEAASIDPSAGARLVERIDAAGSSLRLEYSLDEVLTDEVFEILRRGRVEQGHAIVLDPRSGRLLASVATDGEEFPMDRAYPVASIVKVLTAAALLENEPNQAVAPCVYRGNKYRVNRRRLDRPANGRESSLEQALASSNNQCFSQWAVHSVGEERLLETFRRFGWLSAPVSGHAAGRVEQVETRLDLGRLGSGLDGLRVTPLHVAQLTGILTHGKLIEPWWIDRVVDASGRSLALPARAAERPVIAPEAAARLRSMLVATTTRGTAKSAFRTRRGRRLLGDIQVAGKTGNLTGRDPYGRYEWFLGLAPADDPKIGVVVLQLQSNLWWARSSELAARILKQIFCQRGSCRAELADRWTGDLGVLAAPILISELEAPRVVSRRD